MNHIFLSYSHDDSQVCYQLYDTLNKNGLPLWLDKNDIIVTENFVKRLEAGVNNAAAMVTLLSPSYVKSKYCRRELHRADGLNLPVFPLLVRDVPARDFPLELQNIQYLDFRTWNEPNSFEKYKKKLLLSLQSVLISMAKNALSGSKTISSKSLVQDATEQSNSALESTINVQQSELTRLNNSLHKIDPAILLTLTPAAFLAGYLAHEVFTHLLDHHDHHHDLSLGSEYTHINDHVIHDDNS